MRQDIPKHVCLKADCTSFSKQSHVRMSLADGFVNLVHFSEIDMYFPLKNATLLSLLNKVYISTE